MEIGLPTEAQWEYACRAGSRSCYCFGDEPAELFRHGNILDEATKNHYRSGFLKGAAIGNDGQAFSCEVGKFRENQFGLFDMHGNVVEWCQDWYEKGYYDLSPVQNPMGPTTGSNRVLRGGAWQYDSAHSLSSFRQNYTPSGRSGLAGFRIVLRLPVE